MTYTTRQKVPGNDEIAWHSPARACPGIRGAPLPAYQACRAFASGVRAIDNSSARTASSVASPAAGKDTGYTSDVSTCFDSYHAFPYPFRLEHPTPIARAPYQSLNISRSSRDVERLFEKSLNNSRKRQYRRDIEIFAVLCALRSVYIPFCDIPSSRISSPQTFLLRVSCPRPHNMPEVRDWKHTSSASQYPYTAFLCHTLVPQWSHEQHDRRECTECTAR